MPGSVRFVHDEAGALRANGRETRALLLATAERLFAQRGIDAVSIREILDEAGQRNKNAAQYYFGGRDGLISALANTRSAVLNRRRMTLLDEIEATVAGPTCRTVPRARPPARPRPSTSRATTSSDSWRASTSTTRGQLCPRRSIPPSSRVIVAPRGCSAPRPACRPRPSRSGSNWPWTCASLAWPAGRRRRMPALRSPPRAASSSTPSSTPSAGVHAPVRR